MLTKYSAAGRASGSLPARMSWLGHIRWLDARYFLPQPLLAQFDVGAKAALERRGGV